ncbi:MAG: DUF4191 domain-containing protein [Bifidobacteriaceae bacterium]|jgi:F0F1-type ATP synthase assembly protein I|nr:DUF4191 domain-containing protein [Bifidobacteriaceae bacterium]
MAKKSDSAQKRTGTIQQVIRIYKFTAKEDKTLPWLLAAAFLLPVLLGVILNLILHSGVLSWILIMITAVMLGLLLATLVLTNRADAVGFKQLDGKPGAVGAVLDTVNKAGFSFPREPIWVDPKTKDAIYRGTGRTGVYLIAEGEYGRVHTAMNREEAKIKRIFPGSDVPIIKISVGHGKDQVPLKKLKTKVLRQKVKLTKMELEQLNGRLRTLQNKATGIPKGMDPAKIKISRRALRGR